MDKLVIKKMNSERIQLITISIISQILIISYCVIGILLSQFGHLSKNYNALGYLYILILVTVVVGIGVILLALFAEMHRNVAAEKIEHKASVTKTKIVVNIFASIIFIFAVVIGAIFASKYETIGLRAGDIVYGILGIAVFAIIFIINFIVEIIIKWHSQKKHE